MRLRLYQRAQTRHECRERFNRAAGERLRDGDALYSAGRRTGAIYLWGYSCEMWLKAAFLRRVGLPPSQTVGTRQLQQYLKQYVPASQNLHDITAWSSALISLRQTLKLPLSPSLASKLSACCLRICNCWSPALRYHELRAWPSETDAFRQDVAWIERNRRSF